MTWQVQEAKNKFSEVIDSAISKGPQVISRRGKQTAVLIGYDEYQKLVKPRQTFRELIRDYKGPEMPEIVRSKSTTGRATPIDFNDLDI